MSLPASAERAALAIGRLDAMLNGHPLRKAWEHRTRLAATVQASSWDGRAVDRERLAGVMAGVPFQPLADLLAEHRAMMFLDFLARLTGGHRLVVAGDQAEEINEFDEDLEIFVATVKASQQPSTLLAVAEVAWQIRYERDSRPGILHAAVPVVLAQRKVTRAGIIPGLAAFPTYRERGAWMAAFLDGLATAADDGLGRLRGLALTCDEWRRRIGPRQANSRLPQVVVAALCHPFLTPVGVQRLFGYQRVKGERKPKMTLPGASKLLGELLTLGILTEGTDRRGSHRLFLAVDLGVERSVRKKIPLRERALHSLLLPRLAEEKFIGQQFDELLDGFDASLRRSNTVLARNGIVKSLAVDKGADDVEPDELADEPLTDE